MRYDARLSTILIWIRGLRLSYLLIIFVIALALAPLSHFVPSKAQRRVARMREHAAISGLFVEFRELPEIVARPRPGGNGRVIYYGKRVRPTASGPTKRLLWRALDSAWASHPRGVDVPAALAQLPPAVQAASADADSCGIYWEEDGEEADVDKICLGLEALVVELYQ